MSDIIYEYKLNTDATFQAFDYQDEAVSALKDMEYGAIFHEQGLGKTKIAIDILLYWIEQRDIDTVLIVTKKTLVQNWLREFDFHTKIKPSVLSSQKGSNFYVFNSSTRVIITNFETVSGEKYRFSLFLKTRRVGIIIDESTKIKNPNAKLTKDFFDLAPLFKIRIIMTGTPVANRPYDIWSQIYFLDFGKSLGTDFSTFKNSCDLSNDLESNSSKLSLFEKTVSSIYTRIKPFTVRETKDSGIISLPSKIYHDIVVPFEEEQYNMYERLRTEMVLEIKKGDRILLDESQEAIKRLLRLVQITSNPALIDERYNEISAKEKRLDSLIQDIIQRGEKAIIWSIFADNIGYFCRKYKSIGSVQITGKMNMDERNRSVMSFKKGDSILLFATPQSAKEGLTLTEANNAIFYDRGFNLDDYLQAQDRIHRISQSKDCNIYNLMIDGSIDMWVNVLLSAKQKAAKLAQGDTSLNDYKKIADYSFSQLVHNILNI